MPIRHRWGQATSPGFMGWYRFMWGVFTFFKYIATLKKNRALQTIFLTLWILFFLLALRDWTGIGVIGTIAGYEGILCGASAIYLAMAEVINEGMGKTMMPLGQPAAG